MKTPNLNTMSITELQARMKLFGTRATALCGRTSDGRPLGAAVKEFFDQLLASTSDPAQIAARNEFMAKAEKDPVCKAQLCGIRIETLNNYILASVNIMSMFFETVILAEDERPVVQNTTDQEITVAFIGPDGGIRTAKVVKDDDETLINLKWLATDKVRYRRVDIYRGSIVDVALKTLRMAYDMKNQMDEKCAALLTDATNGAFGAFIYPGSAAGAGAGSGTVPPVKADGTSVSTTGVNYTYLPNSRINTANLPTTNDIVLGDNTSTTKFRSAVIRAIQQYADQWAGSFPEGDLVPSGEILIPGKDSADLGTEVVIAGNTNNAVADALLEKGYAMISYLGRNWVLKADNTLAPGSCLASFNRKPGRVYLKPSLDREVVVGETDYALSQNNEEERWLNKPFGAYINNVSRVAAVRIKYRTT